jgi:hypothetical protein
MSILRVDAIRDNGAGFNDVVTFANSGGTENGKLARAWVNFNGNGSVAIRANFNVNSITDNAVGDYTVNFSNAMSDANYSVAGVCNDGTANSVFAVSPITYASGSFRYTCWTGYDGVFQNISIFR